MLVVLCYLGMRAEISGLLFSWEISAAKRASYSFDTNFGGINYFI
jgi:hypothetical protein